VFLFYTNIRVIPKNINWCLIKTYYICFIKANPHIASTACNEALLKKIDCLKQQVAAQSLQINIQKQKTKKLIRENKALVQEVQIHKWNHIKAKRELTRAKGKLELSIKEIAELRESLRISKLPTNSSNSSRPPSTDIYKPKRNLNYSLREKSGRKPGGQPGHTGSTLQFSNGTPDKEIEHAAETCSSCGKDLSDVFGQREHTHQVVDIAIPKRVITNHTIVTKYCSCGQCNKATFPRGTEGKVNYGNNLRSLVVNLSARQYIPYKRTVEFIEDIFGIPMSQGTITNLLAQFERSAGKEYKRIQRQVFESPVVGSDETSCKVNGTKGWFHTYQTETCSFIGFHPSRGIIAQEEFFPDGLPNAILVSDCLAMQLSTPAAAHQACLAHLLRELKAMEQAHPEELWPVSIKELFLGALQLHDQPHDLKKVISIEKKFENLIKADQSNAPGKIPAFWKRLNKHKDKIFTFLNHKDVPSDNNGSERVIRCVKVKQKVSGQFKTANGAHQYAMNRSIIDTLIKENKNVHEGLFRIASFAPD
jgi:transposase